MNCVSLLYAYNRIFIFLLDCLLLHLFIMECSKENWRFYAYMHVKLDDNAMQIHANLEIVFPQSAHHIELLQIGCKSLKVADHRAKMKHGVVD